MVRQKNRWIIVRLDFEDQLVVRPASSKSLASSGGSARVSFSGNGSKRRRLDDVNINRATKSTAPVPIEPKDIHRILRSAMESTFGAVGAGMVHTIRISLYDEIDRLAIIRVPRDYCNMVRAALTLQTSINDVPVVMSTIGVHGSARTVKIAALAELRRNFNKRNKNISCRSNKNDASGSNKLTKQEEKALLRLEARMDKVREID